MNKDTIGSMWAKTAAEVSSFFANVDTNQFSADRGDRWTLAQNLDHMILSVKPVARGLRVPKLLIRLLFGKASGSNSYGQIHEDYKAKLAAGYESPLAYMSPSVASQQVLLERWDQAAKQLTANLATWNETQLDRLRMPHPLLGKITVREMLYFTDFHTRHHLENCQS